MKLKTDLEELGLSQADLAAALGVQPTTVWRWCNGHTTPPWLPVLLAALERVPEADLEEVLTAGGAPPPRRVRKWEIGDGRQ